MATDHLPLAAAEIINWIRQLTEANRLWMAQFFMPNKWAVLRERKYFLDAGIATTVLTVGFGNPVYVFGIDDFII